jgi:hypothetical protein
MVKQYFIAVMSVVISMAMLSGCNSKPMATCRHYDF